jgi:hypothetical protein
MHEAVRIDDLIQSAPTRAGGADDGTSAPTRYTGTQFIAALERGHWGFASLRF